MSLGVRIRCGYGSGDVLTVDENSAAYVTDTGVPPDRINTVLKPFAELLVDSNGSTDMRVNGSTTPQDFYITAGSDGARFIHTIAITVADAQLSLNEFGHIGTLTNGIDVKYEDDSLGTVYLGQGIKTNFELIQLAGFEPMFGTGTSAFILPNIIGASEGIVPIIDIEDQFGMPYGIRLEKGSTRKFTFTINDDLTLLDRFDVKVFGFDRIRKGQ